MKRMFIVLLSAVAAATFCSGNVPGVTVYADRARVTRMAAPADALHEQIRDLKAKF
jgi:ABC-type glycerol-3-phosphate transport system substrate-binding protein